MKKFLKAILIILLVALLLAGAFLGVMIYSMGNPKPLVSGQGERRIVCVGDSITYGQGVLFSRETDSYTAILADMTNSTVVNYGLSSRTLLSNGDFPYTKEHHYTDSLSEQADVVIIMLGSNDSKPTFWNKEQFMTEYSAMISSYLEMGSNPEVYVMIPPRVYIEQDGGNCDDATIGGELKDAVISLGEELPIGVIDLYALTTDHPEWFSDGLHPNAEGNRAIAEEIAKAIGK